MLLISGMKVIDPVKYRRIYEDVMKKLDKLENEFLPQVTFTFFIATLSKNVLIFLKKRYFAFVTITAYVTHEVA